MGLDIIAYERVRCVVAKHRDDITGGEIDRVDRDGGVALMQQDKFAVLSDGLPEGLYESTGERLKLRSWGKNHYQQFRDLLWKFSNEKFIDFYPFRPFLSFDGAWGFFGPETSALLSEAFERNREEAMAWLPFGSADGNEEELEIQREILEQWRERYRDLARAFAIAADTGVVDVS